MPRKHKNDSTEDAPTTKRPRRTRTNRGALEHMPEMPLDILFEIFRYLMPMDLLNLARTAKVFRRFLMARSAAPLWKAARLNVAGFPECPLHLSEPEYANLAFDTHCNACYKPNVKIVYWALAVRLCPGCRKTNLLNCNPFGGWCCRSERSEVIALVGEDAPFREHWHRLNESPMKIKEAYAALDEEGQTAHKLRISQIQEWVAECEEWDRLRGSNREAELEALRRSRLDNIVARLRGLGWSDELDRIHPNYGPLTLCNDVHKAQVLTNRIWNNIRASVIKHMELILAERLERERLHALTTRCEAFRLVYAAWFVNQTDKSVLPRAVDLMYRPEVRAVLEQDEARPVSRADFEPFTDHFAAWSTEWKAQCDEQLREAVRSSSELQVGIPDDVDPLSLASVAFTCAGDCSLFAEDEQTPLLYPAVLTHDCLYEKTWFRDDQPELSLFERATRDASSGEEDYLGFQHAPWSCKCLQIGLSHQRATKIIETYGMDPSRMTRNKMDAIEDVRIYCLGCAERFPECLQVMNWRHAIKHHKFHTHRKRIHVAGGLSQSELVWKRITDPELLQVVLQKESEIAVARASDPDDAGHCYQCSHCFRLSGSALSFAKDHLNHTHAISDPAETDLYRSPDADMQLIQPTLLVLPSLRDIVSEELCEKTDGSKRAAWYDFMAAAPCHRPGATLVSVEFARFLL